MTSTLKNIIYKIVASQHASICIADLLKSDWALAWYFMVIRNKNLPELVNRAIGRQIDRQTDRQADR